MLRWRRRRYDRLFAQARGVQLFRGVYPSFAEARAAAPPTRPIGYDNPGPSALYRDMLHKVNPRDYPLLFWLSKAFARGACTLLDLGGHVGIKFYAFRKYLDYPAGLRWTVCDVPAVVEAGRELALSREDSGPLGFSTRFENAEGADVLLAAGSLQYVESPLARKLAALERKPERLLLNGVPLYEGRPFVTLQSIGSAFCPYHVFNRDEFVRSLEAAGYALLDEWRNPGKTCRIPFDDTRTVESYSGLYLEWKGRGSGAATG